MKLPVHRHIADSFLAPYGHLPLLLLMHNRCQLRQVERSPSEVEATRAEQRRMAYRPHQDQGSHASMPGYSPGPSWREFPGVRAHPDHHQTNITSSTNSVGTTLGLRHRCSPGEALVSAWTWASRSVESKGLGRSATTWGLRQGGPSWASAQPAGMSTTCGSV